MVEPFSRMKHKIAMPSIWSCLLLLLGPALVCAQDDEEPEYQGSQIASLQIRLDEYGSAQVNLAFESPAVGPSPTRQQVEQVLRVCLGGTLQDARFSSQEVKIKQPRTAYYFHALCDAFPRHGLLVEGKIDLEPLRALLRRQSAEWLYLSISHPPAAFWHWSPLLNETQAPVDANLYFLNVPLQTAPPQVEFTYGYRWRDALPFWPIPVLLSAPIGWTLWRRRQALRASAADPTAAWFRYWRFLRRLILVTQLAWLIGVFALHVRQDWIKFFHFAWPSESPVYLTSLEDHFSWRERLSGSLDQTIGFDVWSVCFYLVPPALIAIACIGLSHPVFARVRGMAWTRGDLVRQAFWQQAAVLLPVLFGIAGLGSLGTHNLRLMAVWFVAAFLSWVMGMRMRARAQGHTPHALTVGELRDRIFDLAQKGKVEVKQVYILPSSKGREANAAAATGNLVVLTDYLLQHLSKREVDAVVAHELAHLHFKHPGTVGRTSCLGFLAIILAPTILEWFFPAWPITLGRWLGTWGLPLDSAILEKSTLWLPGVMIVLMLLGMAVLRTFRMRRFERAADAEAIALTGDPEALITGLAKLARLNLLPMQWGRWEEKLLTHPSTSRRVQALAQRGGIAPEHLQEILTATDDNSERYELPPELLSEERVFSTAFKNRLAFVVSWSVIALATIPPVLVAAVAEGVQNEPVLRWAIYSIGLLGTLGLYTLVISFMAVRGESKLRRRLQARLDQQGILVPPWNGQFAGFAPAAQPRIYEHHFDWDLGFLFLAGDRLCYVGEQTRFALRRDQVTAIELGPGPPRLWQSLRVYVTWHDPERGAGGTFNIRPAGVRSLWHLDHLMPAFAQRLREWREQTVAPTEPSAPLAALTAPTIGDVTSRSPRTVASSRTLVNNLLVLLPMGGALAVIVGLSFSLRPVGGGWLALIMVFLVALFQMIPYWRYRESRSEPRPSGSADVSAP